MVRFTISVHTDASVSLHCKPTSTDGICDSEKMTEQK